jgi:hypothetical protein
MPYFVVKLKQKAGWLLPPIIAHFSNDDAAREAVSVIADDDATVEVKGVRDNIMAAAFGDVPEGAFVVRPDWTWGGESEDTPEPY